MMKHILILLISLFSLAACVASTDMSGFVDPNYRGNFQAKNVLVLGTGMQLDEKKAIESSFIEEFSEYDVSVLSGLNALPPTRNYTNDDMLKIARDMGADTILIVGTSNREVDQEYVPPQYHPGSSTSYVSGYGNYATINTYHNPGYTTGGYTLEKPRMSVSAVLINTMNGETVWTADGLSKGNAFASFSDLIESVSSTCVNELESSKLIVLRSNQ